MAPLQTVFLMYHELELPGRPLCQAEPGYVRYVVRAADFTAQVRRLKNSGGSGLSLSEALKFDRENSVALTFDDGAETDLISAAPLLRELNFGATFFITTGFLGRSGFLSPAQVRELSDAGFEIGCHSITHPYLSDLDDAGVRREVVGAKQELEQILGKPVLHYSCPGGRYDRRVAAVAREGGYASVSTSRFVANAAISDRFSLGRAVVMRHTDLSGFDRLCRGEGLWKMDLRDTLRRTAQNAVGNRIYDRVRSLLLRGGAS
jgi:peptidoglycan/xylan/chitin deacetylase (PgdA/CDA1 family)